jgi:hypothetical protein
MGNPKRADVVTVAAKGTPCTQSFLSAFQGSYETYPAKQAVEFNTGQEKWGVSQ